MGRGREGDPQGHFRMIRGVFTMKLKKAFGIPRFTKICRGEDVG